MASSHGTTTSYTYRKCRCRKCRAAWSAYVKSWRERNRPLAEDDVRHGTVNGYNNFGCRCDACRAARSAYHAEHYVPRMSLPDGDEQH